MDTFEMGEVGDEVDERHPELSDVQLAQQAVALLDRDVFPLVRVRRPVAVVAAGLAERRIRQRVAQPNQVHRVAYQRLRPVQRAQPIVRAWIEPRRRHVTARCAAAVVVVANR